MTLHDLVASERLVDAILAFVVVEAIVLHLLHRRTGRGLPPRALAPNLLSGVGLLLAWRAALVNAGIAWVCASLALALVAHLADLRRSYRRR